MNSYERVKRTIEFTGPDRIAVGGNFMVYEPHGDVLYHFPRMKGHLWWEGQGSGMDEWGCYWVSNRPGDMGQIRDHVLQTIHEFDKLPRPDGRDPARYAHLADELAQRPDGYHVFCNGSILFERMHFLRGFSDLLMDSVLDEEGLIQFAEWVVTYQAQTLEYLTEHFKGRIHGFRGTDDLGTQSGPIMSPDQFRKIWKPFYAWIGKCCRQNGMHFWLHSCGRITPLLDDLIDAGVQVLNPQIGTCGIPELGTCAAGRLVFESYPDLQTVVASGDRTAIREDLASQLRHLATPDGGYILTGFNAKHLQTYSNVNDPDLPTFIEGLCAEMNPYENRKGNCS